MKILGIDPGTARMGWGLIETEPKLMTLGSGVFATVGEDAGGEKVSHGDRLLALYNYVVNKIRSERPDVIVVERLFFNFNVATAMNVAEGRAVVMLAAAQNKTPVLDGEANAVPVFEYTALTAKLILVGHGRAEKKQMISAVKKILGLRELPSHLDDSADALAMALTHHYKLKGLAAPKIEIKKKISSASKSRAKLAKVRRKRK